MVKLLICQYLYNVKIVQSIHVILKIRLEVDSTLISSPLISRVQPSLIKIVEVKNDITMQLCS